MRVLLMALCLMSQLTFAGGTGGFDGGGSRPIDPLIFDPGGFVERPQWGSGRLHFRKHSKWVNLYINESVCLDDQQTFHALVANCDSGSCKHNSFYWIDQPRVTQFEGCAPGTVEDGECADSDVIEKTYIYPRNHRYDIFDNENKRVVDTVELYIPDCD